MIHLMVCKIYLKVFHGDLATRNILLADHNIIKISDFGLPKNRYNTKILHENSKNVCHSQILQFLNKIKLFWIFRFPCRLNGWRLSPSVIKFFQLNQMFGRLELYYGKYFLQRLLHIQVDISFLISLMHNLNRTLYIH